MNTVYSCSNCSHMILKRTAGFIQEEICTCDKFNDSVDCNDGCTFGDDQGPSIGVIPYDIDMSMVPMYQNAYDEW